MNIDRRIIGAGHGPSDDSGSDGEENLRVSRVLKTHEQVLDSETGLSLKWPSVCKVIPERIQHSYQLPNRIEMFYDPTGKESKLQPMADEFGSVVYNNDIKCDANYFSRALLEEKYKTKFKVEKNPIPKKIEPDSLLFESRFECGNLAKATRITDTYYELRMRPDLYTSRHCQWYYFRVQNMRSDCEYRFSFVNFSKPDSQYSVGMKPVLYSEIEAEKNGTGWMRIGSEMTYFKDVKASEDSNKPSQYIMSFTLTFPHDEDTCYLAHCYPYKYSDLMEDLQNIRNDPVRSKCYSQKSLCQTLAGNDVPLVTITNPTSAADMKNKQGILHFLTGDTEAAESLRKLFIFKIVPMLNPDGVIVGNTRCNLAGADLNRQYKHCVKEAFPSVFYTKEMISKLKEDSVRIILYCDLHAHSRKYNVFMYGCENRKKSHKYLKEQIFPYMLHKNAKDRFNFEDCRFTVTRDKEGTGRIVFKNMGILNSYTLEASYGGSNVGNRAYSHFTPRDYENVGRYFCETLLDFNDPSPPNEQLRYKILLRLLRDKSSATAPSNVILSEYSSLSSSECDYTEPETLNEYFLFQNVKKPLRRRLRKKPIKSSIFITKNRENSCEEAKAVDEFSSSSSSESESDCNFETFPLINATTRHSTESPEKLSDLSDISEDEDAINVDVMQYFRSYGPSRDSFDSSGTIEFSASTCQRIHSELLASVNQIYVNLQDSGLKTTSSSSSSLSVGNKGKLKMQKTASVELKPENVKMKQKETRSSSIAEINLKKKLLDDETNKVEKSPLSSKQKQKQKSFAETGQMVVNIKSKPKIKSAKKTRDKEA